MTPRTPGARARCSGQHLDVSGRSRAQFLGVLDLLHGDAQHAPRLLVVHDLMQRAAQMPAQPPTRGRRRAPAGPPARAQRQRRGPSWRWNNRLVLSASYIAPASPPRSARCPTARARDAALLNTRSAASQQPWARVAKASSPWCVGPCRGNQKNGEESPWSAVGMAPILPHAFKHVCIIRAIVCCLTPAGRRPGEVYHLPDRPAAIAAAGA